MQQLIGNIPHRLALAGGWIDQPFVSRLNPAPPGSMVVVSLEPNDGIPVTLDAITPVNNRLVMLLGGNEGTELFASCPQGGPMDRLRGRHNAWITLDLEHAHFFDSSNGARI